MLAKASPWAQDRPTSTNGMRAGGHPIPPPSTRPDPMRPPRTQMGPGLVLARLLRRKRRGFALRRRLGRRPPDSLQTHVFPVRLTLQHWPSIRALGRHQIQPNSTKQWPKTDPRCDLGATLDPVRPKRGLPISQPNLSVQCRLWNDLTPPRSRPHIGHICAPDLPGRASPSSSELRPLSCA